MLRCAAPRWNLLPWADNFLSNEANAKAMTIDLNDPVAVLLAALQALEQAGFKAAACTEGGLVASIGAV